MLIEEVQGLNIEGRFLYWITERENIRKKRESGKGKPWTHDTILQSYRFCNVRRMDDKVSQWLLKNWYEPNFDHPNILLAVALARFINLPSTLEHIGFPEIWHPEALMKKLRKFRDSIDGPIFNSAYMVRGNNGVDKVESVVNFNVDPLKGLKLDTDSMKETWKTVVASYGFGPFMAGQVVADLRHAVSGEWADRLEWAAVGPGSARGLNRLLGEPLNRSISQEKFEELFPAVMDLVEKRRPAIFSRLEAIDVQNCLCEFDKYERTLLEGRRPKSLYPGA
jgi:hypothetical protein|tara:strand:- start:10282 stop:11121 length:840 start_codon:yes stop_codon:yes gene_type:complete